LHEPGPGRGPASRAVGRTPCGRALRRRLDRRRAVCQCPIVIKREEMPAPPCSGSLAGLSAPVPADGEQHPPAPRLAHVGVFSAPPDTPPTVTPTAAINHPHGSRIPPPIRPPSTTRAERRLRRQRRVKGPAPSVGGAGPHGARHDGRRLPRGAGPRAHAVTAGPRTRLQLCKRVFGCGMSGLG